MQTKSKTVFGVQNAIASRRIANVLAIYFFRMAQRKHIQQLIYEDSQRMRCFITSM